MSRTHYRNGDEIGLEYNGCDGCSPAMINGLFCHETGCPEAWRDRKIACRECGFDFHPSERYREVCDDCIASFDENEDSDIQEDEDD